MLDVKSEAADFFFLLTLFSFCQKALRREVKQDDVSGERSVLEDTIMVCLPGKM